eukprot:evm.model.scf_96.8 EVM.evm.TU.scf_96.8   scf_96:123393-125899(+)
MQIVLFTGPFRNSDEGNPPFGVALIEPPCLVAGRACNVVLHTSTEANARALTTKGEGESQASLVSNAGRTVSIAVPPSENYWVSLAVPAAEEGGQESTVVMLALPRSAAQEMQYLFLRMAAEARQRKGRLSTELHYGGHDMTGASQEFSDDMGAKKAAWAHHFGPFSIDFADALEDLISGDGQKKGLIVPLARYLMTNRLWNAASFLLTTCSRCGVPVTLGPFALSEDDVSADNLRNDFAVMMSEEAGLAVGETA